MATVTEQATVGLKTDAPAPPAIIVTEKAAEEVKRIVAEQQQAGAGEKLYLRMRVVGGGCSGFQHKLDLDPQVNPKLDEVFQVHGIEVVVDKRSLLYLSGVTVDFHNDLNRRGFSVSNPQAKSTCGCGSSFSMQHRESAMADDVTHFERLGLPRRFRLDPAALEVNYLARSREVHPDFTGNDPASLQASAALNEAYTTLRDPFRRAEYLLRLAGGPAAADVKQMPAEFLEEMLDLRMRIEEVKEVRDSSRADRTDMEVQLRQRRDGLLEEAARQFDRLEALPAGDPARAGQLTAIRQTLNATKYIQGLLHNLREE